MKKLIKEIIRFISNKKNQFDVLESYGIEPKVIFDVGANKGLTIDLYSKHFKNSKIYAFEAIPELGFELKKRYLSNSRIVVIPNALDKEKGTRIFNQTVISGNSSFFDISDQQKESVNHNDVTRLDKKIEIQCITLDDYTQEKNIEKIDFMKMDIQGAETLALEGASRLLKKGVISAIYVEVMFAKVYENQCFYHDISSFLLDKGYWFYNFFDSSCQSDGSLIHSNALFFSPKIERKKWS
jgi:FkbM family methyltransferase